MFKVLTVKWKGNPENKPLQLVENLQELTRQEKKSAVPGRPGHSMCKGVEVRDGGGFSVNHIDPQSWFLGR